MSDSGEFFSTLKSPSKRQNMLNLSTLQVLWCFYFVGKAIGYFEDLGTIPTFSDWAIQPYTIATYGRVLYKENGRHYVNDTRRNLVPQGEEVEYFKHFLESNDVYVDKSLFIVDVLNDPNRVIRILRPRKWGKTLNLNMLEKFLEIEVDENGDPIDDDLKQNPKLFCGEGSRQLKVCQDKNIMYVLGYHPVISISFKDVHGNGYKEVEYAIKDRLTTAFQKHYYLKKYVRPNETLLPWQAMKDRLLSLMEGDPHTLDTIDMLCSIQSISEVLYKHHGNFSRVYLLIDDFDSPIINAFSNFGHNKTEFKELVEFMQGFLSMGINDNEYIEKVVITGTYHLYMDEEFAGLANVVEYNLLQDDRYATYFGFDKQELEYVLQNKSIKINVSLVTQWYGRYTISGKISMHHPGSVMESISRGGKLGVYAISKANDSFVGKILSTNTVRTALKKALTDELTIKGDETDIEIDPPENYTSASIVLLCNGIFTPTHIDTDKEVLKLRLPNKEVQEFVKKVLA